MKKKLSILMVMAIILVSSTVLAQTYPSTRSIFKSLAITSTTSNSNSHNSRLIQEMCYAYDNTCRTKLGGTSGIDGVFGSNTKEAVKYFQLDNAVSNDGSVGANTWGKFYDYLTPIGMTSSSEEATIYYACKNSSGVQQGWQVITNLRVNSSSYGNTVQILLYDNWRTLN